MQPELYRKFRNSETTRHNDIAHTRAQNSLVKGRFPVNNAGEAVKSIVFPVAFSELPSITFGFELEESSNIASGNAPIISAEVYAWITEDRPPVSRLYTGAHIMVTSIGQALSMFTVVWSASGTAFMNPRS